MSWTHIKNYSSPVSINIGMCNCCYGKKSFIVLIPDPNAHTNSTLTSSSLRSSQARFLLSLQRLRLPLTDLAVRLAWFLHQQGLRGIKDYHLRLLLTLEREDVMFLISLDMKWLNIILVYLIYTFITLYCFIFDPFRKY